MRKGQFTEERIIGILKLVEAGQQVGEVCGQHGISDASYYRWKAQYGDLDVGQLRRLRQLDVENRKLKQIVTDLTLDNRALQNLTSVHNVVVQRRKEIQP